MSMKVTRRAAFGLAAAAAASASGVSARAPRCAAAGTRGSVASADDV